MYLNYQFLVKKEKTKVSCSFTKNSWAAVNKMSSLPLSALLDHMGFVELGNY